MILQPKALQQLRQKLTTGNRRSIHLSALPGNLLNRADLIQLNLLQDKLAEKLLDTLLTKNQFRLTLGYDKPTPPHALPPDEQKNLQHLQKRLNALFYENNDNFLEHGVKPFGIGYPLLIKRDQRDPEKVIKAPVLIWNLDIEKSASFGYKWTIKRDEDFAVYLNPMLIAHLETDEGISLQNLADSYDFEEPITAAGIVNLCNDLLKRLNAGEEYPQATLAVCPGADTLKNIDFTKPVIRWSAVMGIYKTPKQSIIKDIDTLIKQVSDDNALPATPDEEPPITPNFSFQQHTFACVKTDPSQQAVVNSLGNHLYQIIQGPPGTGKSQSLTAVISNALANGAKCLVVCEKRTALEVVYNNLQAIGLANLAMIIEDIAKDRSKVVDAVRQRLDEPTVTHHFSEEEYENLLISTQQNRDAINQTHAFLAQKRINAWNWTDVAGKFLEAEAKLPHAEARLTSSALNYASFALNATEYNHLLPLVGQGQKLYEAVGTLQHPLQALNPMLFLRYQAGELLNMVKEQGAKSFATLQHLAEQLTNLLQEYAQTLEVHYREFFAQMTGFIATLKNSIQTNINLYGNSFNQRTGLASVSVNTFKFMVGKFKNIVQEQQNLLATYANLQYYHTQHPYFEHGYLQITKNQPPTFELLLQNIDALQNRLQEWFTPIAQLIKHQTAQLNYNNPHQAATTMAEQLNQTAKLYYQTAQSHNQAALLYEDMAEQTQLPATQLTIVQRSASNWNAVLKSLPDFRAFYEWQRFYLQLNAEEKNLISALISLNPANWQTAFEYWFFNGVLLQNENRQTPVSEELIHRFILQISQLRQLQTIKIGSYWQLRQKQAAGAFNTRNAPANLRQLYNKRGGKGQQRNSLRKIIHTDFEVFTNFFPVLLLNPVVCSSILPLHPQLFDIVVFDEASQLRVEETFTALLRGKHIIVSGDTHQMPPSGYFESSNAMLIETTDDFSDDYPQSEEDNLPDDLFTESIAKKESLLAYAEDANYRRSYLDFHYRSQHPHLIEFSNAAFYGSRLVTMPLTKAYKAIRLYELQGIYDKSINQTEAEKVIDILLHQIQPLPHSTPDKPIYPSVGVATFNIYQRNLLLETIEKYKMTNEDAAARFTLLEAQGLFVKNLENIQGDERDIMILCTTYGLKPDGKFVQNFGPINQKKGYKLLNVIITRARQQVYICTSVPETVYSRYVSEIPTSGNTGKGIFYAYLAYAKAIETDNEDLRQSILALLARHCAENNTHNSPYLGESSVFTSEVARRLSAALPQDFRIVQQHKAGGFEIDIAIFAPYAQATPIAIECDNSSAHHSPEAYLHDVYRHEQLQRIGYKFYRIYSANWWLSPDKALKDTVNFILTATKQI
ncbi:MAG TPA: AAA domain-containing protein [Chitinophagales bacterium]|nr:AAA domain-containing protein [Chitinophagales bacterium]